MASLTQMTVWDTIKRGVKKVIMECASVQFWAAIACAYANWHIISAEHKFDLFGVSTFCVLIGIRQASSIFEKKIEVTNGEVGKK
jgi:hypothetical protein